MADEPVSDAAPAAPAVDPQQLANLRAGYDLLQRLHGDPRTSKTLRDAIAKIEPELKLPDAPPAARMAPLEERIGTLDERIEKLTKIYEDDRKSRTEASEDAALSARIRAAAENHGFNEEGIKLLTDRMIEQKSGDVEGAAAYVAQQNPRPKPSPLPAGSFPRHADLFGVRGSADENLKLLHTDPEAWQQQEFIRAFEEAGIP